MPRLRWPALVRIRLNTISLGRALCLCGASLGAVAFVRWLAGMESFVTVLPGQSAMTPGTAVALFLLGIAAALRLSRQSGDMRLWISTFAAVIALLIGLAMIALYALDLQTDLNQLLGGQGEAYAQPSSPPTAIALILLAAAILLLRRASYPGGLARLVCWAHRDHGPAGIPVRCDAALPAPRYSHHRRPDAGCSAKISPVLRRCCSPKALHCLRR